MQIFDAPLWGAFMMPTLPSSAPCVPPSLPPSPAQIRQLPLPNNNKIVKGLSLRKACLRPTTIMGNSKPRPQHQTQKGKASKTLPPPPPGTAASGPPAGAVQWSSGPGSALPPLLPLQPPPLKPATRRPPACPGAPRRPSACRSCYSRARAPLLLPPDTACCCRSWRRSRLA